jgi:D-alanyl-D-alanine dipeptidase
MFFIKTYKVYINYFLCRLGLRDTLPRDIIKKVKVVENNDPLIDISQDTSLFFIPHLKKPIFLRQEVYKRLLSASRSLPNGFFIKVHDAYRNLSDQKNSWLKRIDETKMLYPNLSEDEIIRKTRLKIANPFDDGYGGHQTGGAVDITLCNETGVDLNLGTLIPEHNKKTKTKNKFLNKEEHKNRTLLLDVMTQAGFANYPVEWWHFCYGDKMWAAYTSKNKCMYGFIEKD